ncbi:GntR family transcriptional regulator [Hyphomicrobium facile]|uniref:Transcriptional regulator, GntR family n=1 Tax=Hyphomicrobium facile TaxID=51670 RepID=A0A1I7NVI4_9HYPH|nr:GntR family transcriptional regulator [Hyphomicrobium facile]SFV38681.1 transcriptional regulator, GntR family [Hyphomicrobium facile]
MRKRLGKTASPRDDSDKPIYIRGRDNFAARIASGELPPDTQLPSERDLSEELGISRMTARQIYKSLEEGGLIYRTVRQGWFVAPTRLEYALGRSASFLHKIEARGGRPSVEVLEAKVIRPDARVREKLRVPLGAEVYLVRRLMRIGDVPVMIEALYASAKRFPALLDNELEKSISRLWAFRYNVKIARSEINLNLQNFSAAEAKLLGVSEGSCGVGISHVYYDKRSEPIAMGFNAWRGDFANFSLTVNYE